MHEAEIEELRQRVAAAPRDVDAWIRLVTWVWRAEGWDPAREVMHRGWLRVRGDEDAEARFRALLFTTFQMLGDPGLDRSSFVTTLACTYDGSGVLTNAPDAAAHLHDLRDGGLRARLPGFPGGVPLVDLAGTSRRALVVTRTGRPHLYRLDPDTGDAMRFWDGKTFHGPDGPTPCGRFGRHYAFGGTGAFPPAAAISPAGDSFFLADERVTYGYDEVPSEYHVEAYRIDPTGVVYATSPTLATGVRPLGYAHRLPGLVACLGEGVVLLLEPGTARRLGEIRLPRGTPGAPAHAVLAGSHLALVDEGGFAHVLELETPPAGPPRLSERAVLAIPASRIRSLALSPDGSLLAAGLQDPHRVEVREVDGDPARVFHETTDLEEAPRAVALPAGRRRLLVAQRRHVRVFELE